MAELLAQEARLTQALASELSRETILERRGQELEVLIVQGRRTLASIIENFGVLKTSAVVKLARFQETREAIAMCRYLLQKHTQEALENNAQADQNSAAIEQLDGDICDNLTAQAEFGQLIELDEHR